MVYLDNFYSILVLLCESDLFSLVFIPVICLALIATVPITIRYLCFGKR